MKSIIVVDDHALFREGIVSLLSVSGFDVVAQAGDGATAIQAIKRLSPDLVLLDINMPDMDGLETLRQIRKVRPETEVVMLTASEANEDLITAVQNGARGYLLKNLNSKGFIASIRGLEKGEAAMSRKLMALVLGNIEQKTLGSSKKSGSDEIEFSERELELLQHISNGLTNKAISIEVGVSENTVKYHLRNILRKLNAQNRAEAVGYAMKAGIISAKSHNGV